MVRQVLVFLAVLFVAGLCLGVPGYAEYYGEGEWSDENIDDFEGWVLGVGAAYVTSPYEDVDGEVWPVPIVFGRHKRFYIDGTSAGFIFKEFEEPNLDFSAVLEPRLMGYDDDDSDILAGMEDRDWSLDGGLRARFSNEYFRLSLTGVADLTGNHEGYEFNAFISKTLFNGFITPRFGIKWQSEDLVDYYYGVPASEATATRLEYIGSSTVNIVGGVIVAVPLTENWIAGALFQYEHLGSDIEDSPIVDEDGVFTYAGGIVYKF